MSHINIEIKARCSNHEHVRSYLQSHGADFRGTDHQIDTYFVVPNGRLKLREGNIENFLIYYERSDQEGPKESKVILYKCGPNSSLKQILTKTLSVLIAVDKQREIYFIDNVKFHIDTVEGLGTFMEIEAIDAEGTIARERLQEQCQHYLTALGIQEADLLSSSYSDMLLHKTTT